MAHNKSRTLGKEKRADAVLGELLFVRGQSIADRSPTAAFAVELQRRLQENATDPSLPTDLQAQVNSISLANTPFALDRQDQFDAQGTALWNLATRLKRNEDASVESKTICLGRLHIWLRITYG